MSAVLPAHLLTLIADRIRYTNTTSQLEINSSEWWTVGPPALKMWLSGSHSGGSALVKLKKYSVTLSDRI